LCQNSGSLAMETPNSPPPILMFISSLRLTFSSHHQPYPQLLLQH
jgi:hypothetical protein